MRPFGFFKFSNAVLNWQMTEGSGTAFNDSSGNGNTAFFSGGWSTTSPPAGVTTFATFTGSSQASSTSSVNFGSQEIVTVDFWLKAATFATAYALAKNGTGANSFQIGVSNHTSGAFDLSLIDAGSHQLIYTFPGPSTNTWHHIKCVINNNSGSVKGYVDGATQTMTFVSGSWTTAGVFTAGTVQIGGTTFGSTVDLSQFMILKGNTSP